MIIWGRPMAIDLETILDDVAEEAELSQGITLFDYRRKSGDDLFIKCINTAAHGGEEKIPSCSIHRETGMVHCFGCNYSDSLPGLIARVLRLKNKLMGYRWLLRRYYTPSKGDRPSIPLDLSPRKEQEVVLPEALLDQYKYDHHYMFDRGLSEQIIDFFDIGYDIKTKSITIPMRDIRGRLVFIKKRPIYRSEFHRYHIDEGVEKRSLVYSLNVIKQNIERVNMIYLCEGEFDVLSFYVAKKFGAGVQGTSLYKDQVKQLVRIAKGIPICLFFDNDAPGKVAIKEAIPKLRPYFPLYLPKYPPGVKDPNDLLLKGLLNNIQTTPLI